MSPFQPTRTVAVISTAWGRLSDTVRPFRHPQSRQARAVQVRTLECKRHPSTGDSSDSASSHSIDGRRSTVMMKTLHGDGAACAISTSSWRVTGAEGDSAGISRPAAGDGAHAACPHLTQHLDAVRRFVRVRQCHDVEDVVQQTCVAFLENVHRFRGDSSVRTFLLAIAQNVMHGERRRRSRAELSRELEPDQLVSPPSPCGGLNDVAAALALLPAELRHVLELLYWQNLTQAEVAKKLGLPRGTVASRVRRAKDSLRWHLCEAVPLRRSRELAAVVEQQSTVLS